MSIFPKLPPYLVVGGKFAGMIDTAALTLQKGVCFHLQLVKKEYCRFSYKGYLMDGEDVKVVASASIEENAFVLRIPDHLPSSMQFSEEVYIQYFLRLRAGPDRFDHPVVVLNQRSHLANSNSTKWDYSNKSSLTCCLFFNRRTCSISLIGADQPIEPPCSLDFVVSIGGSAKIDKLRVTIKYKCKVTSTGAIQVVPARSTLSVEYSSACFYRVRDAYQGSQDSLIEVSLALPSGESNRRYLPAVHSGTIIQGEYGIEIVAEHGCAGSEHVVWFPLSIF